MILAANWKLHFGPKETHNYLKEFLQLASQVTEDVQFIFFPPALCLPQTAEILKTTKIKWGAQNTFFEDEGAFTGETSPKEVAHLGASYGLVGHSERRHFFKESNEWVIQKFHALIRHNLTPILCVGETLEQRNHGQTLQVIQEQIQFLSNKLPPFLIAYEPVWAIGTGQVATPEQAQEVHQSIKSFLKEKGISDIPVLYGGSVKSANAPALFSQKDVDGFLVGGASLKPQSFFDIYQSVKDML
ncbi:MAG: triose-phosphate isomerase [Bdellovibrio sp.]|nr:MAG: triose-phosphate isomerase [Bdellovibrio sp.]